MSDPERIGGLRRLWRLVNGPVIGPFLLALLFAGVSYYFLFRG